MPETIGAKSVVKMDFIEEFGIANNELSRESKEQSFFIGAEYGLIIANCIYVKNGMFFSYENVIHSENLTRIIQFCKRNGLEIRSKTLNDNYCQVLINK